MKPITNTELTPTTVRTAAKPVGRPHFSKRCETGANTKVSTMAMAKGAKMVAPKTPAAKQKITVNVMRKSRIMRRSRRRDSNCVARLGIGRAVRRCAVESGIFMGWVQR